MTKTELFSFLSPSFGTTYLVYISKFSATVEKVHKIGDFGGNFFFINGLGMFYSNTTKMEPTKDGTSYILHDENGNSPILLAITKNPMSSHIVSVIKRLAYDGVIPNKLCEDALTTIKRLMLCL